MRLVLPLALVLLSATPVAAGCIVSTAEAHRPDGQADTIAVVNRFDVIDGYTVRVPMFDSLTVRLLGFDTPETGSRAECDAERELADRATERLRDLLRQHDSILCMPGTDCGFGRSCGFLAVQVDGYSLDVGSILISEGLAVPFADEQGEWCE